MVQDNLQNEQYSRMQSVSEEKAIDSFYQAFTEQKKHEEIGYKKAESDLPVVTNNYAYANGLRVDYAYEIKNSNLVAVQPYLIDEYENMKRQITSLNNQVRSLKYAYEQKIQDRGSIDSVSDEVKQKIMSEYFSALGRKKSDKRERTDAYILSMAVSGFIYPEIMIYCEKQGFPSSLGRISQALSMQHNLNHYLRLYESYPEYFEMLDKSDIEDWYNRRVIKG